MIKHLYIRNYVLIDELNLDFEDGFSSFTGETGAGKSILIDAISLLAAERASSADVSKGKDKAIIEGTFDLTGDTHARKVLEDAGFEVSDETVFTREIHATGKSYARIDHRVVSLSLLRECLRYEIDIHGQRDNAYLLDVSTHEHLLDEFLDDGDLLADVSHAYRAYDVLVQERKKALDETYNESDLEFFRYQIDEIESASLKEGEDEELAEKEARFRTFKNSMQKLQGIFSLYDDSLSDSLYELNRLVQSLEENEKTAEIAQTVNDSYYSISDAVEQLRDYAGAFDFSEEDINAIEERLFLIQKLKRKYGRTIPDIITRKEEMETQVEMITHRQEYLAKKNREVDKAFAAYEKAASKLSAYRRKNAHLLDEKVRSSLRDLMLGEAGFKTVIQNRDPSVTGNDRVEFVICMNKGEDYRPLSKTASGGELSRLMLGLKEIFTKLQGIQTVIFDEIDTGVSGPVATAIGRKMQTLADTCQVFAVTHLAQVAACADHHYHVTKSSDDTHTKTKVTKLDDVQFREETARIASGEITEASLSAAAELIERNRR